MERYTIRDDNGVAYIRNWYKHTHGLIAAERLAEYEEAEEQGRLLPDGYKCEEIDGTLVLYKPALASTSVKVIKERSAE